MDNIHWITLGFVVLMICVMAALVAYLLRRKYQRKRVAPRPVVIDMSPVNNDLAVDVTSDSSSFDPEEEGVLQGDRGGNDTTSPNIDGIPEDHSLNPDV